MVLLSPDVFRVVHAHYPSLLPLARDDNPVFRWEGTWDTIPVMMPTDSQHNDPSNGVTPVVGRFAPTPSGHMHLGNVFSLLMAWLGARSAGGRIVLRIEDLDPRARDRSVAKTLMSDLLWLGLDWDEGPYFQSDREELYADAIRRLGDRGLTFPCFCTRAELHAATAPHASDGTYVYQGTCRSLSPEQVAEKSARRPPAIRLAVPCAGSPEAIVDFDDLVYGHQSEDLATECGDFVVRRSDGVFAYQLAVTLDDGLMGVNQVVRGRDLMGSVARQMYLQRLLGLPTPEYAHVPLLVAPDGRRLSKRERDLSIGEMRAAGIEPEEIIGMLANRIGMTEAESRFSPDDLIDRFSWRQVAANATDIHITTKAL